MELAREHWDESAYHEFLNHLGTFSDEKTASFTKKLTPGIGRVIGMRVPDLRKMAAQVAKGNYGAFLSCKNTHIYEETLLRGLVITKIRGSLNNVLPYIRRHIPDIDNWALCDTFCGGISQAKKEPAAYLDFLMPYYNSQNPWEIRVALVSLLSFYLVDTYIDEVLRLSGQVKNDHYYVKMGNAWLLSVCYVKYPEKTLQFLKTTTLDDFTYNKAIQKMIESYRVDTDSKHMLRGMKRPRRTMTT